MTLIPTMFIALCAGYEVVREGLFRLADMRQSKPAMLAASPFVLLGHVRKFARFMKDALGAPLIWTGIALWAIEITAWLDALSSAPARYAFPFLGLCYCGVLVASHWLLGESITRRQWFGMGIIMLGISLINLCGNVL